MSGAKDLMNRVLEAGAHPRYLRLRKDGGPRIIVGLGRSVLSKVLGFDHQACFSDPAVCLESQLKWKLLWHNEIQDDTPLRPQISLDFGVGLEASLFGVEVVFQEGGDPWCGAPVIQKPADLDRLEPPDFFKGGIMPRIHRMYEQVLDLSSGMLPVMFPGWARGVWSVACMIRGFTPAFHGSGASARLCAPSDADHSEPPHRIRDPALPLSGHQPPG